MNQREFIGWLVLLSFGVGVIYIAQVNTATRIRQMEKQVNDLSRVVYSTLKNQTVVRSSESTRQFLDNRSALPPARPNGKSVVFPK